MIMMLTNCGQAKAGPVGGDYGEPRVFIPAPDNERYAHLGWPKVVTAPDGTIVVACIAGPAHGKAGCPAVSVSDDGGNTFSPLNILMEFDASQKYHHSGNLAFGVAEDGALVLLAMAFTGNKRNTVYGWRSADCGDSWQRVDTSALADNKTGSVYGGLFTVPKKGLAVCGHYRQPKGFGIWIAYSQDNGRTWGEPHTITDRKLFEPAFTFTAGRLIGLVRDNPSYGYRQFVSDDGGASWQEPELVMRGPPANHPSPFIAADPNEPSRLYALQSQRTKRGEIYLWTADAATLNWERGGLVAAFAGCQDYTYPWMTPVGDDKWCVVFYAGKTSGANSIHGLTLEMDSAVGNLGY